MNIDTVKLIPLPAGAPSPWKVIYGLGSGDTPATYPKVDVPKDSGAHLIVFELSGNHSGITFADQNPMWVKAGSKPGPGSTDTQIAAVRSNDGKQLFVLDKNDTAGQFHYTLNFVGHDQLDPIIDNGGHGFMWGTAELLIGAAVLLTIGFFLRPLFRAILGR